MSEHINTAVGHRVIFWQGNQPLQEKQLTSCLTEAELAMWATKRHPERKWRWLRGRVLVKYAALCQINHYAGGKGTADHLAWPPSIEVLEPAHLEAFPVWMYRQLEITNSTGVLLCQWAKRAFSWPVVLSHAGPQTVVAVGTGGRLGVDLERWIEASEAFYRHNYSDSEHQWVQQASQVWNLPPNVLYTWLWTIKEATIKALPERKLSTWESRNIAVSLSPGFELLPPAAGTLPKNWLVYPATVQVNNEQIEVSVAMLVPDEEKVLSIVRI